MISKFIAALVVVFTLTGCATIGGNIFKSNAEKAIEEQKQFINEGKGYWNAYIALEKYLSRDNISPKVLQFINSEEDFRTKALKEKRIEIDGISHPSMVDSIKSEIVKARDVGFFSEKELGDLEQYLYMKVEEKNRTDGIKFEIDQPVATEYPLNTSEHQKIIFKRTLGSIMAIPSDGDISKEKIQSIIDYLQSKYSVKEDVESFKEIVPKLKLKPSVIVELFSNLMPEYVEKNKKEFELYIFIKVTSKNRLLEVDLISELSGKSIFLNVSSGEKLNTNISGNKLNVVINELGYDEHELHETRETKIISYDKVDTMKAVFFMPRNASYMYEVVSGGAEIEYAYEITAQNVDEDGEIFNKLIRDTESSSYRECTNKRVQNVFGGIQAAEFIANNDMQNDCTGGNRLDLRELRKRVISRLADEIANIPAIHTALEAGN